MGFPKNSNTGRKLPWNSQGGGAGAVCALEFIVGAKCRRRAIRVRSDREGRGHAHSFVCASRSQK